MRDVGGAINVRPAIDMLNQQPSWRISRDGVDGGRGRYNPNRYHLHFECESKEEIEKRKRAAKSVPITPLTEVSPPQPLSLKCTHTLSLSLSLLHIHTLQRSLEVSVDDVYAPGTVLDIPKRPPWSYSMTKEEVESQEEAMFEDYLQKIYSQHKPERLSYFEHNLEVRRVPARTLLVDFFQFNEAKLN